ncbi:tetratricopeptide repeat protein [candidate division WOR-3 bacterium]|nr:tetratricopeptide repeat protein [candidate division WOR-3 bacterium]
MNKEKDKLEKAPNSLIFISLASMYLDNGMVDEAIDLCNAGLEIEPQNEEAHLILARAELEKGFKDRAKKRLIKILERNPENSSVKELIDQIEIPVPEEVTEEVEKGVSEEAKAVGVEEEKETVNDVTEEREIEGERTKDLMFEVMEKSESVHEIITEEEVSFRDIEDGKEMVTTEEKRGVESVEYDETESLFFEKIKNIIEIEGIINCFFRLRNGRIIKNPQLVGNIDDLMPFLDSLLGSVKSAGDQLKIGKVEIIIVEIEKGFFYIFEGENYDCFLISRDDSNFGLLRVLLPKILKEVS